MSEVWHPTKSLAGLPGMPNVERAIRLHGEGRGWVSREAPWGRRRLEWLESSLPEETQAALRAEAPAPGLVVSCAGRGARSDARAELVAAFERWYRGQGLSLVPAMKAWVSIYIEGGGEVSAETRELVPTLAWNTLQRYRSASSRGGSVALLPRAGGRVSVLDADPAMRETAEGLLFRRPNHTTARHILRVLGAKHPDARLPSLRRVQAWVKRWREEHPFEVSAVADPDAHRSRTMPAFGDGAAGVSRLEELWELDSTRIDVMCADGKRYALIAAIDVWSRRAKALVAPTSRATAIAALIRRCLIEWGVPLEVKTDEGADYTSGHLRRVLFDLHVAHHVLPPFRPDLKPFIERFLGTMSRDLFSQLPAFVGHDVADREAIRSRQSFAERFGQGRAATLECGLAPEALQERIDAWCEDVYGREGHSGLGGASPFERAASWAGERRRVDERALDALLAEPAKGGGRRKVNKNGLHVDGGEYIAGELGDHMDQWVEVRLDPGDYGRVYVFDRTGDILKFVCVAEDPLRTGIDREAVAIEAKRRWRAANRAARKHASDLIRASEADAAMDAVLAHASAEAKRVVSFPAATTAHESEELTAAREAADALAELEAPAERPAGTRHVDLLKKFYLGGGSND